MVVRVTWNLLWQDWRNSQICWDTVLIHLSLFFFFSPLFLLFFSLFFLFSFLFVPLEVDRLGCFLWFVFSCKTGRQNYQVADWNPLAFFLFRLWLWMLVFKMYPWWQDWVMRWQRYGENVSGVIFCFAKWFLIILVSCEDWSSGLSCLLSIIKGCFDENVWIG